MLEDNFNLRTITFLAIYHFSTNVENDLIPIIEDAVGFALPDYSKINDVDGQYHDILG